LILRKKEKVQEEAVQVIIVCTMCPTRKSSEGEREREKDLNRKKYL
jgi:hypothetical protein